MFHHAHSYIAARLYSEEPLVLVGSMLPDIAVTKIIPWQEGGLHGEEANKKFRKYIEEKYPEYIDLANGINAHNILDDTSHLEYHGEPGYAFQNNKKITELISEAYELPEDNAKGKAHNYIESAVDIMLLNKIPEVQTKLRLAVNQIDRNKLAEVLAEYFTLEVEDVLKAINQFLDLFTKYDFKQKDNWNNFWQDLEELLALKKISTEKRNILLTESVNIVEKNFDEYLEYSYQAGIRLLT